ncbi:MAG: hypothetical protein KIT69_20240, partial [Propionibacteriaceae bacterium]|nr:hypothetical protein [Propionibacteriaceae bacterium]
MLTVWLWNTPTQLPVLVSVRIACRYSVCAPNPVFEFFADICVPIVPVDVPSAVTRKPLLTKEIARSSEAASVLPEAS